MSPYQHELVLKEEPNRKEMNEMNKPIKKFRAGAISATVWENHSVKNNETITYSSITIERAYKDKDGKWQSTSSYRVMDLPKVELVTRKAYEFLAMSTDSQVIESEDVL
jgi:hypothetical protein